MPTAEVAGLSITSYVAQAFCGVCCARPQVDNTGSSSASHSIDPDGRAQIASRTVYAAAKLGLADQLASGPRSAGELARAMDLHALSLYRLMRMLASLGILTDQADQRFALTNLGRNS